MSRLTLAVVAGLLLPAALLAKGPPWISIELPANPWDPETRNAFLVVHAFHHEVSLPLPVTGTAEGIVDGKRRSVPLQFERTSRTGAFALRNQWGARGKWVLIITVNQGDHGDVAQAMVRIAETGQVVGVEVPTSTRDRGVPRRVTSNEIEAALTGR